ncbi:TetR family transcriptional regulator [Deinococcus sp. QL22]|uniref:TetR family transcriptional regulator n=1 Tax=Deinococcus sp. QL22 TaxID=2939437 RepID=UPI0020182E3C|nr:TetR family transcriptional regulator [Deinococcus sp. QL22]UQN09312.1 TetR family transcriptional regulator [Deinococcus sp. QL22]
MSRWNPNARGRLEQAALELYSERGFEQTTVSDIAARAGLTERTFFRHFTDKREVLFGGAGALQESVMKRVSEAPLSLTAIEAVTLALGSADVFVPERREYARQRQRLLAANPELQERELMKLASMSAALAGALRGRGSPDTTASLTADAGMAIFMAAFGRWIDEPGSPEFGQLMRQALGELRAVLARPASE